MHTHVCTHADTHLDSTAVLLNAHIHFLQLKFFATTWILSPFPLHSVYLTPFQQLTAPSHQRHLWKQKISAHSLKNWCPQGPVSSAWHRRACFCRSVYVQASMLLGKQCSRCQNLPFVPQSALHSRFSWAQSHPEPRPHSQPPLRPHTRVLANDCGLWEAPHPTSVAEVQALRPGLGSPLRSRGEPRGRRNYTSWQSKLPPDLWNWHNEREVKL